MSAVYRWITRGVRGVSLDSIKIGGTTYTNLEALQRFADELSETINTGANCPGTTVTRQRQIDRAEREVAGLLGELRQPKSARQQKMPSRSRHHDGSGSAKSQ